MNENVGPSMKTWVRQWKRGFVNVNVGSSIGWNADLSYDYDYNLNQSAEAIFLSVKCDHITSLHF